VKRPAWLFSARARVSSHLADLLEALVAGGLEKPGTSRCTLGLTGDGRLEVVLGRADGTSVTGSPTSARKSKCPKA
jgi:hypothetical protein